MSATFGLDFGTTNSLISYVDKDSAGDTKAFMCLDRNNRNMPHPSVVWYRGDQIIVGQKAKEQLDEYQLGVSGDFIRSPKAFLGSPTGIPMGNRTRPAVDVVSDILRFLRDDAIKQTRVSNPFELAVATVPVSMDGAARAELRDAALKAGIRIYQFVHEPMAALYGYLRSLKNFQFEIAKLEQELMLVFDWGGGTLDLTLCRLERGILTQIENTGDKTVGGDQFDQILRNLIRGRHEDRYPGVDWDRLQDGAKSKLIAQCEDAKIQLSGKDSYTVFLKDILAAEGPERDLEVRVTRDDFNQAVRNLVKSGLDKIDELLDSGGLDRGAIKFCLGTGGMVAMPAIREGLQSRFGLDRVKIVERAATLISEGAAWIAYDDVRVKLAKSFEVLHADDSYVQIAHAGLDLPTVGTSINEKFSVYCVDPSDGFAKFQFARPQFPNRENSNAPRKPYTHVTVPVDKHIKHGQTLERLEIDLSIDENLIANIEVRSTLRNEKRVCAVHDLEFGLSLVQEGAGQPPDRKLTGSLKQESRKKNASGSIRVRSNVAYCGSRALTPVIPREIWDLVPGEQLGDYNMYHQPCDRQRKEKMYYARCSGCGRTHFEINEMGGCGCEEKFQYGRLKDQ